MQGVTIVDHPLVQHKLTLIRDKTISTKSFRELLKEIGMLLCYEVTRDLPLTEVVIETPLASQRQQTSRRESKLHDSASRNRATSAVALSQFATSTLSCFAPAMVSE